MSDALYCPGCGGVECCDDDCPAALAALSHARLRQKIERLVKMFKDEERIFNQHACDTSPDSDEHWYYKVEARVWAECADELERVLKEAGDE